MNLSDCGFQYHKFMNLNALFLNETERYPQPQVDIYIYSIFWPPQALLLTLSHPT
jgi:hypothetical protein